MQLIMRGCPAHDPVWCMLFFESGADARDRRSVFSSRNRFLLPAENCLTGEDTICVYTELSCTHACGAMSPLCAAACRVAFVRIVHRCRKFVHGVSGVCAQAHVLFLSAVRPLQVWPFPCISQAEPCYLPVQSSGCRCVPPIVMAQLPDLHLILARLSLHAVVMLIGHAHEWWSPHCNALVDKCAHAVTHIPQHCSFLQYQP